MCQRSDQTWNLYWKMRGKRLVEEATTERFSTWPWATHQTELKRVLFIIVVWLSMEPCLSVCQSRPFSLLSSATCPLPDVFIRCRKDAALSSLHSRTAPWSSGEAEGYKQAQNSAPHTGLFSPHVLSFSWSTEALGLFVWLQRETRAEWGLTESQIMDNTLSGHFLTTKSVQSGDKNVFRSRRSYFTSTSLWHKHLCNLQVKGPSISASLLWCNSRSKDILQVLWWFISTFRKFLGPLVEQTKDEKDS